MEKIFSEAILELEELIKKHMKKMDEMEEKYGIDSEQYNNHEELVQGFILRMRQTKYLMEKFGIKNY